MKVKGKESPEENKTRKLRNGEKNILGRNLLLGIVSLHSPAFSHLLDILPQLRGGEERVKHRN
jgi:hypothetical protein